MRAETPTDLPKHAWWGALKRTFREFMDDNLPDWAAALTYYSVLSLFPAVIVLASLIGLVGDPNKLADNLRQFAPSQAQDTLVDVVRQLAGSSSIAGPVAIIGLLSALWAASGYLGAFIRASNAIYEVEEGRPIWKTIPLRIALTLTMMVLLTATALGVVLTGGIAERVGRALGLGSTGIAVWDIAKWPVLALLVSLAIAILFWAAPNVRQPGFRWVTPGSLLAVLVWAAASAGFAIYVANFASYNKVYGSLAGVVVFLVWLWLSNLAIVFGAEFDAELTRGKEVAQGLPEDEEPFLPPRDTRAMD
ncbi:YihY/virulence factor BrkB family protein [Actinophytocola algeriensis]|uniref:Membrane protein n=1 Tax=Actinophytocola algeriensis TaxID=1768010 RepID=A0A7W7Q255_9PSEU|nr:YihY/virulence factor BrkB family protein [Actinophytocola algeriensis]MBB4905619.1 membrane protein [Actinophytocola algeriensis]MBE1472696.1 membrane protein [Actinophytocola algeriensis]